MKTLFFKSLVFLMVGFSAVLARADFLDIPMSSVATAELVCGNEGGALALKVSSPAQAWQTDSNHVTAMSLGIELKINQITKTSCEDCYFVDLLLMDAMSIRGEIKPDSSGKLQGTFKFQDTEDTSQPEQTISFACQNLK